MKRPGLDVPSRLFPRPRHLVEHQPHVRAARLADIREVRREAREPDLLDRLMHVVDEQRGHSLAMEIEEAKIALSEKRRADLPLYWVEPGLGADIDRPGLVSHTRQLAERIAARIDTCLAQAGLTADEIDAVFMTGGSTKLAHVRDAIIPAVPRPASSKATPSARSARA